MKIQIAAIMLVTGYIVPRVKTVDTIHEGHENELKQLTRNEKESIRFNNEEFKMEGEYISIDVPQNVEAKSNEAISKLIPSKSECRNKKEYGNLYVGYLLAERTVTIDGPEGTQINMTFIGEYSYINNIAPGEHLEVPVRLEFFKIGEPTPYNITYELIESFIHGTEIMDDERNRAFEKLEEEKFDELKNTFESK